MLELQTYPTTLSSHNLILLGKLRPEQQAEHLVSSTDLGTLGFLCALVMSIAVRKHQDQSNLGGGEVISACASQSQDVIIEEDQSRNSRQKLESEREAETMRNAAYQLALSSWLAQSPFSSHPGPPAQGLYCPQWVGPLYINH